MSHGNVGGFGAPDLRAEVVAANDDQAGIDLQLPGKAFDMGSAGVMPV